MLNKKKRLTDRSSSSVMLQHLRFLDLEQFKAVVVVLQRGEFSFCWSLEHRDDDKLLLSAFRAHKVVML